MCSHDAGFGCAESGVWFRNYQIRESKGAHGRLSEWADAISLTTEDCSSTVTVSLDFPSPIASTYYECINWYLAAEPGFQLTLLPPTAINIYESSTEVYSKSSHYVPGLPYSRQPKWQTLRSIHEGWSSQYLIHGPWMDTPPLGLGHYLAERPAGPITTSK